MSDPIGMISAWAGHTPKETRNFLEDNNLDLGHLMVYAAGVEGERIWTPASVKLPRCCCGVLIYTGYSGAPCKTCELVNRCYTCATTGVHCDDGDHFWLEEDKLVLIELAWAKKHAKSCKDPLVSLILGTYAREEGSPRFEKTPFGLDSFASLLKSHNQVSQYMKENNAEPHIIRGIERGLSMSFVGHSGWEYESYTR